MKISVKTLFFLILIAQFSSCQQKYTTIGDDRRLAENLEMTWELVSNQIAEVPQYRSILSIKNNSDLPLKDSGWAIFFNQESRKVVSGTVVAPVAYTHLGGDFNRLSPREGFQLLPGEEISIQSDNEGWRIKAQQAPEGIYIVFYNDNGEERSRFAISNYTIKPFTRPEQISRFTYDQTPVPTPEWQYEHNAKLSKITEADIQPIIPSPISASFTGDSINISSTYSIHYDNVLQEDAAYLIDQLKILMGGVTLSNLESTKSGNGIISLQIDKKKQDPESYVLNLTKNEGIRIQASDAPGVFYGIQSLLSLFPVENYKGKAETATIPVGTIKDAPRFPYRGMHLDVSRNFNKKEAVFKLIDAMAFYKLNKLHLHLTDDEGWRLEILGLPELTEKGAFRGHTLDDSNYLHPSYGSGPDPTDERSYGNGYYTQEEYIEILKYANSRHIAVIPEFDMPGHARAAIKSMEARYQRLISEGEEQKAREFRLADPDDASVYNSAQDFNDNVICVCQESAYRFIETVIDEVIALHNKAQVPLETIHIGGDEVPKGAWARSPLCEEFLLSHQEYSNPADLMDYFLERTAKILKDRNIILSGWEEIALKRDESGDFVTKPPADPVYQVYIWDNFTTGNQDIGYRIANAGYPVVLCSVTNYYFELAYNKDPYEPGHYWGGFVDTRKAYEYIPFDVFKSIHTTPLGKLYDRETDFKDMERLDQKARANILGIQGELWSEPIRGPEMLEYFYLPKMLGLSERAWAGQPEWAAIDNDQNRETALENHWNVFANIIGSREMPRMDYMSGGYNYRLPPPGAKIRNGILYANTEFPGLTIRFTTDGSEPTVNSSEFTEPVQVEGKAVHLRTFNTSGRGSRVITVQPD